MPFKGDPTQITDFINKRQGLVIEVYIIFF